MSLKLAISYPVPMETTEVWQVFKPFVERFVRTWQEHPPCTECTVYAVLNGNSNEEECRKIMAPLPVEFVSYPGQGMDLGGHQWLASYHLKDEFMCCMTTRMYFHRRAWGYKLIQARKLRGPALYGMSHSYEGGKLHLCTRGHSLDAEDMRAYPHCITSRDQGVFFECGDGCLMEYMERLGRKSFLVTWKGTFGKPNWNYIGNRFRTGDQSAVLCFDKHTDLWRDSDEQERARLTAIATTPPEPIAIDAQPQAA